MEYNILIVITKDRLCAADLLENGSAEEISIYGNPDCEYENEQGIVSFVNCLKDEYALDDFNEMNVTVLIAEAFKENVRILCRLLDTARVVNVMDIQKLLGSITAIKQLLSKKEQSIYVRVLNQTYQVRVENEHIYCQASSEEKGETLAIQDIANMFLPSIRSFGNEEEILHIKEQYEQTLEQEREKYQTEVDKILVEKNEIEAKCQKALKQIQIFVDEKRKIENERDNILKKYRRILYFGSHFAYSNGTVSDDYTEQFLKERIEIQSWYEKEGNLTSKSARFIPKEYGYKVYNVHFQIGSMINKGEILLNTYKYGCESGTGYEEKVQVDGKIIYIVPKGKIVYPGDIVAVLGIEEDTGEDINIWMKQILDEGEKLPRPKRSRLFNFSVGNFIL